MKRTLLNVRIICVVLIAGLAISSCNKDSSSTVTIAGAAWTAGTPTFTAMVGTKTISQYFTDVMGLNSTDALQYTTLVNLGLMQAFTGTVTFKSDNTYTSNLGGVPDSGTWSLSADAKKLTITSSTSAPETADVTVLTSTKLTISMTDTTNEDLNDDGIDEIITVHVEIPFTR